MVGDGSVVGDEPLGEFLVEEFEVAEEQVFVVIDELLLDGAVEAFDVGVHLGAFGVGPEVGEAMLLQDLLEVPLKLGTVVREELQGAVLGQSVDERLGDSGAMARVLGRQGHRKGDGRTGVDHGQDIAA